MTEDTMKIHCEGLEKGSKAVLGFKNKRFKQVTKEKYCEKDYEKCKLYQTLDKKYQ